MKRFLSICIALIILLGLQACAWAEGNLVSNGDFSRLDSSGLPEDWSRVMWFTDEGVSLLYVDENGYEGSCIAVVNADPNDARFAQTIAVEPNSLYRFSAMVKVENCTNDGYGATLSFADTFSYSDSVLDTRGEWRELTVYGSTGPDQTEVTLYARVGGYGMINSGRAWFDNITAEKVDALPEGVIAVPLEESASSGGSAASADTEGEPKRNTEAYLLLGILYGILMLALVRRSGRLQASSHRQSASVLTAGLCMAFALRILLAVLVRGYNTDINCFSAWSERMFDLGPAGFYAEDYFCDYPPGYMLLLWLPAALRRLAGMGVQSLGHILLLKLIPIICDMLGALLIWRTAAKQNLNRRIAAALALLYAFNPAVIIDSAAWGQIDSVFTLLVVICALKAADERYIPALLAFAGAMLIKPQAMLFAPLGLLAIIVFLVRRRSARKFGEFAIGVAGALLMIYLAAFIFCVGKANGFADAILRPVSWIIDLYGNTLGSYAYLTINALNLYCLLGYNWVATEAQPLWTIFAWCMFALAYLYSAFLCIKSRKNRHLPLAGAVLIALIFAFGPMIHERYIFPALLLLGLACIFDRDKRLLLCLTVMTITTALNELLVLQGGMGSANYGHLQQSEQWLNAIISLVNTANALYLSWVALDICCLGRVHAFDAADTSACPEAGDCAAFIPAKKALPAHRMGMTRKDVLLIAAVTLVYSVVAFVNLGSTQAPQSFWVSSQSGENITFDLGGVETFHMSYYGGICNSTFTVELSNDNETWTQPHHAVYSQGDVFKWIRYVPVNENMEVIKDQTWDPGDGSAYVTYATNTDSHPMQTARYVRITAKSAGLRLGEFGFVTADGTRLVPQITQRSGEYADYARDPGLLTDEQHTIPDYPSYYNSSYFDEIYHARTAYEMLHGDSVYEWTHPPLGKALMSVGIHFFGMTPFGWRFMGTLIGAMMLPLMYLLAKQLTKSTKLSFIAMCLMALDSMHFTQTRIATIDSYAVFWIMLMYLFMFRYFQMDWRQVSLGRSLVPLGLCGVTMGVAIATKWIGAYAAVGLAVLFFWKIFKCMDLAGDVAHCRRRIWITILFCVGFFVIIPVLIYYFSYTPHLRYEGVKNILGMFDGERVKRVAVMQKDILDYHAGLGGDTHFFRSPWYQWPIIWWPMWYFSGTEFMEPGMISSISCMGNPAVWWTGLAALIYVLVAAAWRRRAPREWIVVLIGFASQFLPWVLVPRSTFIYHYFASVPFIILCTVLALGELRKQSRRGFNWVSGVLLGLALVLFIAFYPLESGLPVSRSYAQCLRWFNWYNF